jgi:OFA family oxalate/formate antiporter-like MFS transporter
MKRYRILAAAVVMTLCLGATYSWSVYVPALKQISGLSQGAVQLPFSVFYAVFPLTVILSGTLLSRLGPRVCAVAGGIAFGGGWMLAGLGGSHFAFTVTGIGMLAGVGVGFAYIVPIAVCIQWFPRHRGLVTGIAVAGFGGGAALVSQAAGHLMHVQGLTPFAVFGRFGLTFLAVVTLAGLAMEAPALERNGEPARRTRLPLAAVLGRSSFWVLYAAMFCGLAAGFAVNANLRDLCPGSGPRVGILAVSLFAVANALGRVLWGWLFDRVASSGRVIRANLLCQAAVLLCGPWFLRSEPGLLVFALLTGLNYGGVLVVYAASAARLWGNENVGQVYGWLFSSNAAAALAPVLAGVVYDRTGQFTGFLFALGLVLLAAALPAVRNP